MTMPFRGVEDPNVEGLRIPPWIKGEDVVP